MAVDAIGSLSSYTYQSALSKTGSPDKALAQGLAMAQAQVAEASSLFSNGKSSDSLAFLGASANLPSLASLTYTASAGAQDATSSAVSTLPASVALLAPSSAQALARYAYDQSQSPANLAAQAASAAQQSLLASGLNLLA